MKNTKHQNDFEFKDSNWLLQLENKWTYVHYNSIVNASLYMRNI